MKATKELTGRTRHRRYDRWLRKPLMVLMVEVRYQGSEEREIGNAIVDVPYDFTVWVEASPEDMWSIKT